MSNGIEFVFVLRAVNAWNKITMWKLCISEDVDWVASECQIWQETHMLSVQTGKNKCWCHHAHKIQSIMPLYSAGFLQNHFSGNADSCIDHVIRGISQHLIMCAYARWIRYHSYDLCGYHFCPCFFFFEWKDLLLLTSLFLPDKLRKTFTAGKIEHNDFNAFENSQGEDWWSLCTVCANSRLPWLPQHRREYQEQKHQYENFRIIISGCTRTSQPTVWSPEKMETVTSDSSSWEIKLVARNDGISGSKPSEVKQSSAACLTQSIPFDTSTGSDGAWGFCTTGVHFVISTALPYAIHVDHIVKT